MATLSGTVKDSNGAFAARVVRVYRRDSGAYVGMAVSDGTTGAWSITTADTTEHFAIVHDGTADDVNFGSVVLLLHGDGTNNSTTITDSSAVPKTVTAYGDAKISTAQSKFGGASIVFDGTGDYLQTANHADFDFGSGDFTVECWLKTSTTSGYRTIISKSNDGATSNSSFYFGLNLSGTGSLDLYFSSAGNSYSKVLNVASPGLTDAAWHHLAISRSGQYVKVFVDGSQVGSTLDLGANYTIYQSTHTVEIGCQYTAGAAYFFNGYIDDLRITKGVARYTGNFTPPSAAFSVVSGGSANALIYDRLVPA